MSDTNNPPKTTPTDALRAEMTPLEVELRMIIMEARADGHNGDIKPKAYYTDKILSLFQSHDAASIERVEIKLLRDTADGFQSELKPEFAKGGQAAINALRRMADHKEAVLQQSTQGDKS